MIDPHLIAVAAGLAAIYVFFWALLHLTQDAKEPPSIEDSIPFLSPIFTMMAKGANHHRYLSTKYNLPIHTLRLPGSRLYVINDTSLIPVVQRQVRTLSFSPLLVRVFSHFMGISPSGMAIMGRDPIDDHGFLHQMMEATGKGLAPGPELDAINTKAVSLLNASLSALCASGSRTAAAPTTVKLFEWASLEIMMATTNAIYGPRNPFKDPAVREAYYKLEGGLMTLLTGVMPSLLARESLRARDVITEAFLRYYAEGGLDEDASFYARSRYEYPVSLGVPPRDVARMETGGSIGLISNTMPATFWTLWHAFSDPAVLADCRREVLQAVVRKGPGGQSHLDLALIKSACPTLVSTMQEAFRLHSIGMSARSVEEDHLLGGKYLLKKGSTLLIPSTVQHSSKQAWGEDVQNFNHQRFVKDPATTATRTGKKHNPVAFRAFGGGATLCPGRHFASTEILAFASVILLRFDVRPRTGSWDTRGYREANAAFRLPKQDVDVELIPRDDETWHIFFSESGKPMEISTEDISRAQEAT